MIRKIGWIVLFIISACEQRSPEEKLKRFVDNPDNKITQKLTVGDIGVVTKFLPASYRMLMGVYRDSMQKDEEQFYFFDVKFNINRTEKPAKEKLLYLNFDMQSDFVLLVNNRDSVTPAICQKIENGIAGSYEYLVVFERNEKEEWNDFTLIYNDKIFSIGTVAFVYNGRDIRKIPGLKPKEVK